MTGDAEPHWPNLVQNGMGQLLMEVQRSKSEDMRAALEAWDLPTTGTRIHHIDDWGPNPYQLEGKLPNLQLRMPRRLVLADTQWMGLRWHPQIEPDLDRIERLYAGRRFLVALLDRYETQKLRCCERMFEKGCCRGGRQ